MECVGKYPFTASKCEFSRNWHSDITVTALISATIPLAGQIFVKKSYTKFLENLISGLVAGTRQLGDRWADTVSKNKLFFFTSQGMLKVMTYIKGRLSQWKI